MADYSFITSSGDTVQRAEDGAFIPWDAAGNHPIDTAGRAYQQWIAEGSPVPAAYVAPPVPLQDEISPRQFYEEAAVEGIITRAEALAFMVSKTLPKILADPIGQMPEDQQFSATMALMGTSYSRGNPFTGLVGQLIGKDAAAMDTFWRAAAAR